MHRNLACIPCNITLFLCNYP